MSHCDPDRVWRTLSGLMFRRMKENDMNRTSRRAGGTVVTAALVLATVLALAPAAQAAVSVSRAELRSGQLRVEGAGAQPGSTVTVRSSASSATATADSSGAFRVEGGGFSAPDCRVTVG